MAQQHTDIDKAANEARLALLKKITELASRTSSGTVMQQLSVAYRNVTTPHLEDIADDEPTEKAA
jgi:hypothetical protein